MTDIAGCLPLVMSWIYHRFTRCCPRSVGQIAWPLASRLIGFQDPDRDRQEGRLLRWREELDRSDIVLVSVDPVRHARAAGHRLDWIRSH
ncbi:hypothetical protein PIB30_021454 [Stylosanthes scabra]|uniref:Uncharacterized protein n=1 Tax=Stylosanthes scabra TaxID=79078 RepID=A0ABU6WCF5_9FABA|nr:hypothetical protein [Stylosanthes scabra]